MTLDEHLKAAIADYRLRWQSTPPTQCERTAVERLESSGAAWDTVLTEKARYVVPVDHRKVLRFVIDSFKLVEGESKVPTLEETRDKFAKVDKAFDTLTSFYKSAGEGYEDQLAELRSLIQHANIMREFTVGDAVQFPIIKKTKAGHDHGLNFACGLSYFMRREYDLPFEKFCLTMPGVLYADSVVSDTAFYYNCRKRESMTERALKEAMQRNDSAQE